MLRAALGDERGIIHRRGSFFRRLGGTLLGSVPIVGGVAKGLLETAGVLESRATACPPTHFLNPAGQCQLRFAGGAALPCGPRQVRDASGVCQTVPRGDPRLLAPTAAAQVLQPGAPIGIEGQLLAVGEAVLGRFGAGFKPAVFSQQVRLCPRGSILGAPEADGTSLCYNRGQISNKERMWPRGRRPLLTGGEMRAITIASGAARKLQAKHKQLQELGLLKKPVARKAAPKALGPGIPRVVQIQQE